jgi:hypothetical protein
MRNRLFVLVAAPIVVAACSSAPGTGGSAPEPSGPVVADMAPAKKWVQENADMDTTWKLLARKYFNNDTEVVSFYEPTPGNVIAIGVGHPTGAATLKPSHDAVALWGAEEMPQALVDALGRKAAGVGMSEYSTAIPADAPAPASLAPSVEKTEVPAPANEVSPFLSGYCDNQWFNDFPTNLSGPQTSYCELTGGGHQPPPAGNGAIPQWVASFSTNHNQAVPYNNGAGCSCSCRTIVGFQEVHDGTVGASATNEWENFGVVCPVQGNATIKVSASQGTTGTFSLGQNFFGWIETVGSVSCFGPICTSTNTVNNWSMTGTAQLINGVFDFY